jgi:thiamine biosynthesis lipoprotein
LRPAENAGGFRGSFHPLIFTAALLACISCVSCAPRRLPVTETRIALGTYVKVNIVTHPRERNRARRTIDELYEEVDRFESAFDYRTEEGGLTRFNRSTRMERADDPILFSLIQDALAYARETDGYFDPTILPIIRLWGFDTENPRLPADEEIRRALDRVGYSRIRVGEGVIEKPPGLSLDLSGIAKGRIVDLLRDELLREGFEDFLLDAGGDISVGGMNARGEPWRVAIQDPVRSDAYAGILQRTNISIVTSGDYERFFIHDDRRYGHLFDPSTGYPADDLTSVTVLTEEAAFGDAVATAVFVMGRERGYRFLREREIEGLLMFQTAEGLETRATPGFWDR